MEKVLSEHSVLNLLGMDAEKFALDTVRGPNPIGEVLITTKKREPLYQDVGLYANGENDPRMRNGYLQANLSDVVWETDQSGYLE